MQLYTLYSVGRGRGTVTDAPLQSVRLANGAIHLHARRPAEPRLQELYDLAMTHSVLLPNGRRVLLLAAVDDVSIDLMVNWLVTLRRVGRNDGVLLLAASSRVAAAAAAAHAAPAYLLWPRSDRRLNMSHLGPIQVRHYRNCIQDTGKQVSVCVCMCVCLYLSLSRTHSHTLAHTSLSLSLLNLLQLQAMQSRVVHFLLRAGFDVAVASVDRVWRIDPLLMVRIVNQADALLFAVLVF
jgi:hypothetical protein